MSDPMNKSEAKTIVTQLANGIDPTTGEVFPEASPYNNPKVIRALFTLLGEAIAPSKSPKSVAEKQTANLNAGKPRNAGMPWTDSQRTLLRARFMDGASIPDVARELERSRGAIISEATRLGLLDAAAEERMP